MSLIGKKVKGFKFKDKHSGINYLKIMDRYVGVEGVIERMGTSLDSYEVKFTIDQFDRFDTVSYWYPASLIEKHLVDEFVLPEKWYARVVLKEIDIVNQWIGPNYFNFHGGSCFHYDKHASDTKNTPESYTEITFEQFKQYVLKQEKQEKMEVKKSDLEKIHVVACPTWKSKIEKLAQRNVFGSTIELTQIEVGEMFSAATESQRPVLVNIFGEPTKSIDLSSDKVGGLKLFDRDGADFTSLIAVRSGGELENKAFYLNSDFKWEIKTDGNGLTCLVPTRK